MIGPETTQNQRSTRPPRSRTMGRLLDNALRGRTDGLQSAAVTTKAFAYLRDRVGSRVWMAWIVMGAASVLGIFALAVGIWTALNLSHDDSASTSPAMYTVLESGRVLEA